MRYFITFELIIKQWTKIKFLNMSHTKVKTTYKTEGAYGGNDTNTLYCHHNHSTDITTYYDSYGDVAKMIFDDWVPDDGLFEAMHRLWHPYKDVWGGELKDGVEYCHEELNDLLSKKEPA